MTVIERKRPQRPAIRIAVPGVVFGAILAALAGLTDPAQARHKEHTVYGSVSGYQATLDRDSAEYKSDDAFCQTDASVAAAPSGSALQAGGGGNQFRRLRQNYARCMESRGAWQRIETPKPGDQPGN
ncbi:hypothetical protein [Nguyenibacter sp. L1]|uniref:hypothetical protein n=1 Tax=Nguyenibacter sp. L1 TaxID=3049350 RepID=UPI002B47732C|nr:hypothetical protein [Nguyenibacter sp. L1]WRH87329.1 hypothetical protein QN315_15335 [Nguyenibacter sp. L1]